MEYLKRFLEKVDDLQKFCNDNLAYLIDEGFNVEVTYGLGREKYTCIEITKIQDINSRKISVFNWEDYKQDIIPFIEYLYEKYNFDSTIEFIGIRKQDIIKIAEPEFSFYKRNKLNDKLEMIDIKYSLRKIYLTKGKKNYYK
jgi:hypothetical protein